MTVLGAGAVTGALVVAWFGKFRHMGRTLLLVQVGFGGLGCLVRTPTDHRLQLCGPLPQWRSPSDCLLADKLACATNGAERAPRSRVKHLSCRVSWRNAAREPAERLFYFPRLSIACYRRQTAVCSSPWQVISLSAAMVASGNYRKSCGSGYDRRVSGPLHLAFLGCGFITRVHSRHLRSLKDHVVCSYASREKAKADAFRRRYRGVGSYGDYTAAIDDPHVDAVVLAVPPCFHLDLTLQALRAGKHVLVEKPAYPQMEDYEAAVEARDLAQRIVLVGENDHYRPLAVRLRQLLADNVIGEMIFRAFHHSREAAQSCRRLAQRRNASRGGRLLRGRDPLAPPCGQSGPGDHHDSRLSAECVAGSSGYPPQEHDGSFHLRQWCGWVTLLLQGKYRRSYGDSAYRSFSDAMALSLSSPMGPSCWSTGPDCRSCSSRVLVTSADTGLCIETFYLRLEKSVTRK